MHPRHTFFNTPNDIYLCATYIPPQYSLSKAACKTDYYANLTNDIATFQKKGSIIIAGDLNSRVGTDVVNESLDIPALEAVLSPERNRVPSISLRASCDSIQNQHGKKLLKLCQKFCLKIANGRTPGDLLGNFTCFTPKGSSVVDLVIGDQHILKRIIKLKVLPPQFLSVHCPITFCLQCNFSRSTSENLEPRPTSFIWDKSKEAKFIQELRRKPVLTNFITTICSEVNIENMVEKLSESLISAAKSCMKIKKPNSQKKVRQATDKVWFNPTCQSLKAKLTRLAKSLLKNPKDPIIRGNWNKTKKLYRKTVRDAKFIYQKSEISKLSNFAATDPKLFWSHLKKNKWKS